MSRDAEIAAALEVMKAHSEALNARDEERLAATLHFPHFRMSETRLAVWDTPASYFSDFRARAGADWTGSSFEDIHVLQTSSTKVHLDVRVDRYGTAGAVIESFRSLWVITLEEGRWAAKFRSSFAAR